VFAIDIEICRGCGGRLRVIASIEAPAVIERILEHFGRDAEFVDPAYPCRAPHWARGDHGITSSQIGWQAEPKVLCLQVGSSRSTLAMAPSSRNRRR
jgi:hypothetical protein